jgi:pimeloyl-ACP methyl ester carboxylesterase
MAYVEFGKTDAPAVVLIHGVTGSHYVWTQIAPVIAAAGYHVIVPNLRGHGPSDKPQASAYTTAQHTDDINALLNVLGIKKANITGHSLGSLVAQGVAAKYPDKVSSLVLIGSAATLQDNATLAAVQGAISAMGDAIPEEFISSWYGAAATNYDPSFSVSILDNGRATPAYAWKAAVMGCEAYPELLPKITVPVQILWGTTDGFFGRKDQDELIAGLTSTTALLTIKEGNGHDLFFPERDGLIVAADILGFLASIKY